MSLTVFGFRPEGGGGGLNEDEVNGLIANATGTFVSNYDPTSSENTGSLPVLSDASGKVIKRSRVTIEEGESGDTIKAHSIRLGDSYSLPSAIGEPGQILVVPSLGSELKFLNVDPTPIEIDDLQSKVQNVSLPLTVPGQTTFIGNVGAVSGLTVGLPDAPDAWNLLPGHGQQGDQLLFPGGDSSDAYWGKAPAITVLESQCQNIDYNMTSPTRTEFIGRVSAENGFGFNTSPNTWTIPATRGVTTGHQMLWDNDTRETYWGDAPKLTSVYNKTLNMAPAVQGVTTAFSGLVAAERFLVGDSPSDWKIGPGQGVYGDSLTWPETGSTAVWSVPPSVQTLQEQTQFMSSEPLGTDFALRVAADSLVSNSTVTVDAENPSGSYILPLTRGTPGQVLVAGGLDGSQCVFENAVVTPTDLSDLQIKTQNLQSTTTENSTLCNGTFAAGTLAAEYGIISGRLTFPPSQDHVSIVSGNLGGFSNTGYSLPRTRGVVGQGLIQGELGAVNFTDVASPTDLDAVLTRTQYQSTTELQDRLTTFDGRLRLQPVEGSDQKQVIFPDSRSNYGGAVLRTSMTLNQSELVWQFPSYIRRFRPAVLAAPTQFTIPAILTRYTLMPFLTGEVQSVTPTWQYYPNDGVAFLGASNHGMYRVVFSAMIGLSTNPAPAQFELIITHRASSVAAPVDIVKRYFTVRKDTDPLLVYLEGHGKNLTPGSFVDIVLTTGNNLSTLEFYDASFEVSVY